MRKFFVLIHRYVGLAMTLLLVLVALTGSLLAFFNELDGWLNPQLLRAPASAARHLDPFVLRERAEALEPNAYSDYVWLNRKPGTTYGSWLQPKVDPRTGGDYKLSYNELFLDPYTGEKLGVRQWGKVSLAKENLLPFLYRLHYSLALPEIAGNLGGYILGITALVWTIDCFIGFYLTLPAGRRTRDVTRSRHAGMDGRHPEHRDVTPPSPSLALDVQHPSMDLPATSMSLHPQRAKQGRLRPRPAFGRRSYEPLALAFRRLRRSVQSLYGMTEGPRAGSRGWWQRWKPAWLIKRCRFNYDLHRAWGLWLWAMLFVLAWSSVCLNLNTEIYQPVMKLMFDMRGDDALPELEELLTSPALGWREAHAVGTHLIGDAALQHDFTVAREEYLLLDRTRGVYQYVVRSSDEIGKSGGTRVVFDANSGELKMLDLPKTQATGDVITRWLVWLHTARVFGLPMQIFVCLMGLVITALSVTGVIIWLRKRHAQHHRVVRLQASEQSAAA